MNGTLAWVYGKTEKETNTRLVITLLLFVPVIVVSAYLTRPDAAHPAGYLQIWVSWALAAAAMIFLMTVIGVRIALRPAGVLISERNTMSMSRLQVVLWTVLISSSFLAIALARAFHGGINPNEVLDIAIPKEVWELLGLSGGSTLLASMVQSSKSDKDPDVARVGPPTSTAVTPNPLSVTPSGRRGILPVYSAPNEARFANLFQGDELANHRSIDLAKVQLFIFTVVGVLAYGAALFQMMDGASARMLTEYPAVTPTLVTILGISHATYLGNKAVDKTPTVPKGTTPPAAPLPPLGNND